ncbi:hypothetical protein ElyMa_003722400 [Elysia marginata]|uniref:Uncharacterized protein n=1 Tax=Elysia marginata TaxID=1093978 RepID=A0AAV4F3Y2_9GAST|nr:hypothetical protein ElyMa_003722400 [Elysia marginata]
MSQRPTFLAPTPDVTVVGLNVCLCSMSLFACALELFSPSCEGEKTSDRPELQQILCPGLKVQMHACEGGLRGEGEREVGEKKINRFSNEEKIGMTEKYQ